MSFYVLELFVSQLNENFIIGNLKLTAHERLYCFQELISFYQLGYDLSIINSAHSHRQQHTREAKAPKKVGMKGKRRNRRKIYCCRL